MENRVIKFFSKESNLAPLHAIPGHFATSHSHINYYIDLTSLKTRTREAEEVARIMASRYVSNHRFIDTIVCMDGTEVVGAYLAQEFQKRDFLSTNRHDSIYVITPELNATNQMIFRDNTIPFIKGKNIVLLLATTTTGVTIRRSIECIQYYEGTITGVSSIFSTVDQVDGLDRKSVV